MAFTSKLYPGEIFADDRANNDLFFNEEHGRGLMLELKGPEGYGSAAKPFPKEWLIPPSEYQARIQEIEERGLRLSERMLNADLPCKYQERTNYCWINAPTHCIEVLRTCQNQERVILSPASAGAPIKGFRNQGGWGLEGIQFIGENGLVPVEFWPANAIDRRYYTDENKALALHYRQTEWYELINEQECVSFHLRFLGTTSACGYAWWKHETTRYEPIWLDGELAWRDRNSWGMNYGHKGFFILRGRKKRFDDCVAPVTAIAS